MKKIYLPHASDYEFATKLYEPIKASPLASEYEFLLPQDGEKMVITKDLIKSCAAVVGDVSRPSLGVGIEMGWASCFDVPVFCIAEKGSKVSGSVNYVSNGYTEYENADDLIAKLTTLLTTL